MPALIRLLKRSPVNPLGINLGDRYEVLDESETEVATLGEKQLGLFLKCCPELSLCDDLRVELVTAMGTHSRDTKLLSYHPPYAVFQVVE